MIYAKVIECYDNSMWFDEEIDYYNNIIIDGSSNHFNSYNDEPLRDIKELIDNYYEYEYHYNFRTFTEYLEWYAPKKYNGKHYSQHEKGLILKALQKGDSEEDIILLMLGMVYGEPYHCLTLKGCSQGDWVTCYAPVSTDYKILNRIETLYFNTGCEVIIHDTDSPVNDVDDIDGYGAYICDYDIKHELAEMLGVSENEITLYEISGYVTYPTYKVA